ncbi:MAG: hypothetical protein L6R41_002439 [Letrouitia leprolyta]|nr:MAG: hypothetical protein L6R41_002439 [Letrouitia leprolyta]
MGSQEASNKDPSIASVDFSELQSVQCPTGVPFETFVQYMGSHFSYDGRQSDILGMILELDLLASPTTTSSAEVFADQTPFTPERHNLRVERNREILATVDNLFSDINHSHHQDSTGARSTERGPREERPARREPLTTFADLEKQSCGDEPRSIDHRRRRSGYDRAAVCFMMFIAAFAWQYYNLVHN